MDISASKAAGEATVCFLFDNGSLRPAATLALRALAASLAKRLPVPVEAVSLLHSSGVPAEQLNGEPARLLEIALANYFNREPSGTAVLLPLFFGPSGALTDYVPARMAALQARFPAGQMRLADCLVQPGRDDATELITILQDRVCAVMVAHGLVKPRVVLVDHGTPQPAVSAARDFLGRGLARRLGADVAGVTVASMERRAGPEYAFNEPLLETCLRTEPNDRGDVIVALQFLSPGRHAGPEGDLAEICRDAAAERPELRLYLTETMAGHERMVEVLARRYHESVQGGK